MTTKRKTNRADRQPAETPAAAVLPEPLPPPEPTFEAMSFKYVSFEEHVVALATRALAGEGNPRQAESYLRAAEMLERQAGQYRAQVDAIKRHTPEGSRSGIRLSHLAHTITRTVRDRDRYMAQAEAALNAAPSPPLSK